MIERWDCIHPLMCSNKQMHNMANNIEIEHIYVYINIYRISTSIRNTLSTCLIRSKWMRKADPPRARGFLGTNSLGIDSVAAITRKPNTTLRITRHEFIQRFSVAVDLPVGTSCEQK